MAMNLPRFLRRLWARISQPGTGGLIQSGDWRVRYSDGQHTFWMSFGDALSVKESQGGILEWRGDVE